MKKAQFAVMVMMVLLFVTAVQADPPILVDRETGKYLGNLNSNQFDPNSINNPLGLYGSEFSSDSINNRFGRYGSQFSSDSVNNQFATGAPVIIHRYDNSRLSASYRNPIDELNSNLAEHNRILSEHNRIIENELFQARQEKELNRSREYLRDFYEREKTDWSKYVQPNSHPIPKEHWEYLKEKFVAQPSGQNLTKPTEEPVRAPHIEHDDKHFKTAKALLEEFKKRNPDTFKDPEPLPDLSKTPKWADVIAKPEFSKLTSEEKVMAKIMYFDYWIAPHVSQQQAESLLRQFMDVNP